jgi:hypothetical protein
MICFFSFKSSGIVDMENLSQFVLYAYSLNALQVFYRSGIIRQKYLIIIGK